MSVTRLVAPKPRKPALAFFDGSTFEKTSLMAMPDGVESFLELSISPSQLLDSIKQMSPDGELNDQIDELIETVRTAGQIDLQKDLLAHLGPRMVAYLGPGQSAATNDDSLESALSKGWSPTAAVTAMQSVFPKLTLVAEVNKPEAFSKGLDAAIIAINGEMKAQAMEKARRGAGRGREKGRECRRRQSAAMRPTGGDRGKRRRSLHDTAAPRFTLTPTPGNVKSFVLMTHSDLPYGSARRAFARPFSSRASTSRSRSILPRAAALAAVQRKDWKPSSGLERACESLPPKLVALFVDDVTDRLPSLLASLPGTLQTMINTSIALANARAGKVQSTAAGMGQPGGQDVRSRQRRNARSRRHGGGLRRGSRPRRSRTCRCGQGGGGDQRNNPAYGGPRGQGGGGKDLGRAHAGCDRGGLDRRFDGRAQASMPTSSPRPRTSRRYLFPGTLCFTVSDQRDHSLSRAGPFRICRLPNGLAPIPCVAAGHVRRSRPHETSAGRRRRLAIRSRQCRAASRVRTPRPRLARPPGSPPVEGPGRRPVRGRRGRRGQRPG